MLGMGSDADSNAGSLLPLVCLGYHDYPGVGKPLPPMVPTMQHAGTLAGAEQASSHHRSVRQGGGKKVTADGGKGDLGDFR